MNSIKNFPYNNNGAVSEIPTLPTGTIIPYSTASAPDGYLSCNGAAISRETYKKLFAIIGTTYGSGDGSTTFNIPNLSNAIMPTSNNVAVKGTGLSVGYTRGTDIFSLAHMPNYNNYATAGFAHQGSAGAATSAVTGTPSVVVGLTTNSSKSGIVGTLTSTKMNFIIKY